MKEISFAVEHLTFLNSRIFELCLRTADTLPPLHCGQFIHLKPINSEPHLRRPFCLYKFTESTVSVAVAVTGKGTKQLSTLKSGDLVSGIVPLGNGFRLNDTHQNIALVGGGIGCAPLLAVQDCYPNRNYTAYLGFSTSTDNVFAKEFSKKMPTFISTDDGSEGYAGYVSQHIESRIKNFNPDVILTCGPAPMLKAIAQLASRHNFPAYASLEQRMGCGVGACLVCVCSLQNIDGSRQNLRVCADGPVFDLLKVIF